MSLVCGLLVCGCTLRLIPTILSVYKKKIYIKKKKQNMFFFQENTNYPLTFCLWDGCRRSAKGDWCGCGKASRASVLSSCCLTLGSVAPLSARCSWAYTTAFSTWPSFINSKSTSCYNKKGAYVLSGEPLIFTFSFFS